MQRLGRIRSLNIAWAISLMVVGTLLFVGCGGEAEDRCSRMRCGAGEVCLDGVCVGEQGCESECLAGEFCRGGRCLSVGGGCDYSGQACGGLDYGRFTGEHLCMDWQGGGGAKAVCSEDCREQGCEAGAACYLVNIEGVGACAGDDECLTGQFCYQGSCAFAACRPPECDVPGGLDERCGVGRRCEQLQGGLNLCVAAGTKEVGQACLQGARAYEMQRMAEACVDDAACVSGVCRAFCQEGTCADGGECVPVAGSGDEAVMICARSCEFGAASTGCEPQATCLPTQGGGGICQPAGSVAAFAACELGGEGCEAGTICAVEESGEEFGRCLPVCDLNADGQQMRDATCPQADPAPGAWTVWHLAGALGVLDLYIGEDSVPRGQIAPGEMADLGEAGPFERREPARISWALRPLGDAATEVPLVEGEFVLGEGEVEVLMVMAEPGVDRGAIAQAVALEDVEKVQWFQGIADLEVVDIWGVNAEGERDVLLAEVQAGELRGGPNPQGIEVLELRRAGAPLVEAPLQTFDLEQPGWFIALQGTVDGSDLHALGPVAVVGERAPDMGAEAPLRLSCRGVNGGSVGACLEICDGLENGRCRGESMGCGPRYHQEMSRWATVCQPQGEGEVGEDCNPFATRPCSEGLYCQAYGEGAEQGGSGDALGRCTPRCELGDDEACGGGESCRAIDAGGDYPVGECRYECSPDGYYTDEICPAGLKKCLPEATLIPIGDGINAGYDIRQEQPYCWASGSRQAGMACEQGQCEAGHECLFERSRQVDQVSTLLSPYFGTGGAVPRCRPICDPFDGAIGSHSCAPGETCLFNYPYNADVGHCAEIVEEREIGQACEEPGMACGEDSICVIEGGAARCLRFCQFTGQTAGGYEESSCPSGYGCAPYVRNIGVCRAVE